MVINIRGTSGSGKSHLIREVMERCTDREAHVVEGRRRPLYYTMTQPTSNRLAVVGHYETPCGGCDTIPSLDRIYQVVWECNDKGWDVLYEGLLISAEVNRVVELAKHADVAVIGLDVPLQTCIDSVNKRRWAKNPEKPGVNPKNTEAKWKQTRRALERIGDAGIPAFYLSREAALNKVCELLWT
jgi:hypothetical protein